MISKYNILFEVEITHSYFESGFCEDVVYKPSTTTQKLIDKYSLKFLNTDKGFQFYSSNQETTKEFLNYIAKVTGVSYFEFMATTTNNVFYQYTDLPINELGVLIYNSNEGSSNNNVTTLKQKFEVKQTASCLFSLIINFEDVVKYQESNSYGKYRIEFFSRATQWQYNIINNSKQHFNQLSIKGDSDIQFNSGESVKLNNGQLATRFTSTSEEISLTEVPKYKFDLLNITERLGNKKEKTVFKGLPMPNPKQLEVLNENDKNLVLSPMYVYI